MISLRDNIIHEAQKLFSLNGFLSTGINDIIRAAGTSKGGFYNHFCSKEELFLEVLAESQKIWRDKVLYLVNQIESPTEKINQILVNYRDLYLKDSDNFPGGCIFITFSVELDDTRPHLMQEVNKGFVGLKNLLQQFLEEGKEQGELKEDVNINRATELIFSGMIGTSVLFGADKSTTNMGRSINSLIDYLDDLTE
jgi:TetR/AcrR family transcriptional repressor of nem operon